MPPITSRWPSQPQTMATRRGFPKWRKHGVISPSWQRLKSPQRTTTADSLTTYVNGSRRGLFVVPNPHDCLKRGTSRVDRGGLTVIRMPVLAGPPALAAPSSDADATTAAPPRISHSCSSGEDAPVWEHHAAGAELRQPAGMLRGVWPRSAMVSVVIDRWSPVTIWRVTSRKIEIGRTR